MSDRSIHLMPKPAAPEGQAANNAESESEVKAVDLAISSSLFLAPRQELLKTEAEVKREMEEGAAKPKKA